MEGLYKASIVLPFLSGLAEDVAVNTLYFLADSPGTTIDDDTTAIQTRLVAFFNTVPTGGALTLGNYIGDQVQRTANRCKVVYSFFAGISPPADWGTPVATKSWTLHASSGATRVPAEVAVVFSYHADLTDVPETEVNPTPPPATIRPAARMRGRIFIGPLNLSAMTVGGPNGDQEVSAGLTTTLTGAGHDLLAANTGDLDWVQCSRADDEVHAIVGGYVDNALDTQRRRGTQATTRTAWT